MAGSRLELQTLLETTLGSNKVYFQAPDNTKLSYPCIKYERDLLESKFANNNPYILNKRYKITVIDTNPDSLIPELISKLPMCQFDRAYKADNLNHNVFNIYF